MNIEFRAIFEPYLYTVAYHDAQSDEYVEEYERLVDTWISPEYWIEKGKELGLRDLRRFAREKVDEIYALDEQIARCDEEPEHLERIFQLLSIDEDRVATLPRQKAKIVSHLGLRVYALRLLPDIYIITGGALKQSQEMADHEDTRIELNKLNNLRAYMAEKGVTDATTFEEFIADLNQE